MKKLAFIFIVLFAAGSSLQTHAQAKNAVTKEPVEVLVYNAKDKIIGDALVSSISEPLYRVPDQSGVVRIYPKDDDTIYVTVGNYVGAIPYTGGKRIELLFDKSQLADKNSPSQTYSVTKLPKFNLSKIYTNPNIESYGSLIWLIQQKFPSIHLVQDSGVGVFQAYLSDAHTGRDVVKASAWDLQSTTHFAGTGDVSGIVRPNTAKVFVDGKLYPNIHKASNEVKLSELVNIRVEKPDSFAGKTGTGAIYITTLKEK